MSSSLFNRGLPPRSVEERFSKAEPCARHPFGQYSNPHPPLPPSLPHPFDPVHRARSKQQGENSLLLNQYVPLAPTLGTAVRASLG